MASFKRWMDTHGVWLRRAVATEFGTDDPHAIEWLAEAVIARAMYGPRSSRLAFDDPDVEARLEELAATVCQRMRQRGVEPWRLDMDAIARASEANRRREWRRLARQYPTGDPGTDRYVEMFRTVFGPGAPVVLLLPRRLRNHLGEAARSVQERLAAEASVAMAGFQVALPMAAPVLRQAATVVVAAALSLAAPMAAALPSGEQTTAGAAVDTSSFATNSGRLQAGTSPPESVATGPARPALSTPPDEGEARSEAVVPPTSPSLTGQDTPGPSALDAPVPPAPQPGARVRTEPPKDPIDKQQPDDGGTRSVTPPVDPLGVDRDGDGEDDTTVPLPQVHYDCPPPEERGTTEGVVCPVLDEVGGDE